MIERNGRRMMNRFGEAATVYSYDVDPDDTDEMGDPTVTEQTTETVALFRMPRATIQEISRPMGDTREITPTVWFPDDVATEVGAHSPTPIPEIMRDPEVVRHRDGKRFRIVGAHDEANGLVRTECEEVGFDSEPE